MSDTMRACTWRSARLPRMRDRRVRRRSSSPMLAEVEKRAARFISRLPLRLRRIGTRMKSSSMRIKTRQVCGELVSAAPTLPVWYLGHVPATSAAVRPSRRRRRGRGAGQGGSVCDERVSQRRTRDDGSEQRTSRSISLRNTLRCCADMPPNNAARQSLFALDGGGLSAAALDLLLGRSSPVVSASVTSAGSLGASSTGESGPGWIERSRSTSSSSSLSSGSSLESSARPLPLSRLPVSGD